MFRKSQCTESIVAGIEVVRVLECMIYASLFSLQGGTSENDRESLMYNWHHIGTDSNQKKKKKLIFPGQTLVSVPHCYEVCSVSPQLIVERTDGRTRRHVYVFTSYEWTRRRKEQEL